MEDLGILPGGVSSVAEAINSLGQIVGCSELSDFENHAFLYSAGTMHDLGTLPNYTFQSEAFGINDSGQVVGESFSGLTGHAFLYSGGTMTDLNSFVTTPGWTLETANGINDSGQICATGINPAGQEDACLLTPVHPGQVIVGDPVVDINDLTIVLANFGRPGWSGPGRRWTAIPPARWTSTT